MQLMDSLWPQGHSREGTFGLARREGRLHIVYPAGRYRSLASSCLIFSVAFAVLAWLLPAMGAGTGALRLALGTFATILAVTALALPFSALEIVVDPRGLVIERSWCGRLLRRRRISTRGVTAVEIEQTRRGLEVFCVSAAGRLVLFTAVAERRAAEALRSEFLAAAALSRPSLRSA